MVNWTIVWSIVLGIIIAKLADIFLAYVFMYIGNVYAAGRAEAMEYGETEK